MVVNFFRPGLKKSFWPSAVLVFLGAILVLRLVIWKFLRVTEIFFREEFSNVAVAAVILLLALVWAVHKLMHSDPVRKSGLEIPLFLWLGAAAGSLFYTADLPSTLAGVIVLAAHIAFFYILLDVLDSPRRIRWALFFFIVMSLVVAGFGIREFVYLWSRPVIENSSAAAEMNRSLYYILTSRRVVSFLGWPNSLAGYLLLVLPLVLFLPFWLRASWQRILSLTIWPVFLACFVFTFSFLGWSSFLLATLILIPVFWKQWDIPSWPRERKYFLILMVLVFCGLFLWVILRKNFLMSLAPRVQYYQEIFSLILQKPFLGHGWGTFGILSRQFATDTNGLTSYAHNSYLQVWVEAGIAGFAGIVSLVVLFLRRAFSAIISCGRERKGLLVTALTWGMTAFFIDNLFSFTMLKPNIALYGWAMLAVFCAVTGPEENADDRARKTPWGSRMIFGAAVLACALMLGVLVRIIGGYLYYYEARYGNRNPLLHERAGLLMQAELWDPWSSYIPAASGELRMNVHRMTRDPAFLKEAQGYYLEAIRRSPHVYAHYFTLGSIYGFLGNDPQAGAFYSRARALSPVEFSRQGVPVTKRAQPRSLQNKK